jgi:hypothetical protein
MFAINNKRSFVVPVNINKKLIPQEYRILHRVADNMSRFVVGSLTEGINTFKKGIDERKITSAIDSFSETALLDVIPFEELPEHFDKTKTILGNGLKKAGEESVKTLPKIIKPLIRFDTKNPRIVSTVENEIGNLITEIVEESRKGITQIVKRSFDEGLPSREIAKIIPDSIGLNVPQSKAVINRRILLEKEGVKGRKLDELVKKYAEQKLKERKTSIARTETIRAVNMGQQEVWMQAADEGLLNLDTAKKRIVVTPDDRLCPICLDVDGQEVLLTAKFQIPLANGGQGALVETAPFHPSCRCAMELVLN